MGMDFMVVIAICLNYIELFEHTSVVYRKKNFHRNLFFSMLALLKKKKKEELHCFMRTFEETTHFHLFLHHLFYKHINANTTIVIYEPTLNCFFKMHQ